MAYHHARRAGQAGDLRIPPSGSEFGMYRTDRHSANVTDVALKFIAEKSKGPAPGFCSYRGSCRTRPTSARRISRAFQNITLPPNVPAGQLPRTPKCLPDYYGMIESIHDEFAHRRRTEEGRRRRRHHRRLFVRPRRYDWLASSESQTLALRRIGPSRFCSGIRV